MECFLIFRENFIGTRPNGLLKSQCQSPTTMCRVAAGNGDAKCLYQPFQERSSLHTLNSPSFLFFTPGAHCSGSQLCRKDPILHRHIYIYLTIDFLQLPRSACVYMCWTSVQTQKPSECQQLRHYLCYLNSWHAETNLLPLYQYLLLRGSCLLQTAPCKGALRKCVSSP